MKLFLVSNELNSKTGIVIESVYVVAADSEEEALSKAAAKAAVELRRQRVRPLVFDHEGLALVWMGAPQTGEVQQMEGKTKRDSGMRDGR
ncbi:hypothetical protein [Oceanithermus sp.]